MEKEEGTRVNRRDFFYIGAAGVAGLALAGAPRMGYGAEKPADPGEVFMMFPGNYTWSAATRGVIATCLFGGGDMGEIYKVCAALRGKVGDGAAWFYEWNKMAEKVALLGDQAREKGCMQTATGAYLRAGNYIQTGERLKQPRTPETQQAYARSVELFKKGTANHPFLIIEPVEVPFAPGILSAPFSSLMGKQTLRFLWRRRINCLPQLAPKIRLSKSSPARKVAPSTARATT